MRQQHLHTVFLNKNKQQIEDTILARFSNFFISLSTDQITKNAKRKYNRGIHVRKDVHRILWTLYAYLLYTQIQIILMDFYSLNIFDYSIEILAQNNHE